MIKITYKDRDTGAKRVLNYDPDTDTWSGDDSSLVARLNESVSLVVRNHEYYPTPWHQAKHVADTLNGKINQREPRFPQGDEPGVVH